MHSRYEFWPKSLMHSGVAAAVLFNALLMAIELTVLPISAELSSLPSIPGAVHGDIDVVTGKFVFSSALRVTVQMISFLIWPGSVVAAAFGFPIWWAIKSLFQRSTGPKKKSSWAVASPWTWRELVISSLILTAAAWELIAVLELRKHRASQRDELMGHSTNGDHSGREEKRFHFFCRTGPFAICRHPINFGLLCTAGAFAVAVPSSPLSWASAIAFTLHLVAKVTGWTMDANCCPHFRFMLVSFQSLFLIFSRPTRKKGGSLQCTALRSQCRPCLNLKLFLSLLIFEIQFHFSLPGGFSSWQSHRLSL